MISSFNLDLLHIGFVLFFETQRASLSIEVLNRRNLRFFQRSEVCTVNVHCETFKKSGAVFQNSENSRYLTTYIITQDIASQTLTNFQGHLQHCLWLVIRSTFVQLSTESRFSTLRGHERPQHKLGRLFVESLADREPYVACKIYSVNLDTHLKLLLEIT